jgi:hypothetical protein
MSSDKYGNSGCVKDVSKSLNTQYNSNVVNNMDKYFLRGTASSTAVSGVPQTIQTEYASPNLQSQRPIPTLGRYVELASKNFMRTPDVIMSVFFSDSNINHIRNTIVQKVKEITAQSGVTGSAEGVTIQPPPMDDLFHYMVKNYENYTGFNGSICFINNRSNTDPKQEIIKLNTKMIQEYTSNMVSQINMYIYYFKDASQLPEQMSRPVLTSMKGSKTLEYNTGFTSGNSQGIAAFSQRGNIIN